LSLTACVPLFTQSGAPLMLRSLSTTVLPPPQAASARVIAAAATSFRDGSGFPAIFMMGLLLDEERRLTDDLAERVPRRHAAGFACQVKHLVTRKKNVSRPRLLHASRFRPGRLRAIPGQADPHGGPVSRGRVGRRYRAPRRPVVVRGA